MTLLARSDIGRLVTLRSGEVTRISGAVTQLVGGVPKTLLQHDRGLIYPEGYADPLGGAGALSPADIMRISDVDPITGKMLDAFDQDRRTVSGYYGDRPTQWAGHSVTTNLTYTYQNAQSRFQMTRLRMCVPFSVRRFKVRTLLFGACGYGSNPTVYKDAIFGSPADTNGAGANSRKKLAFQYGYNPVWTPGFVLPANQPITHGGGAADWFQHDYDVNSAALAIQPWEDSDIVDIGFTIDAFEPWDFRSGIECEAAYESTGGVFPATFVGSNWHEGYDEFFYSHVNGAATKFQGIKGKGAAHDLALEAFPNSDVFYQPTGFLRTQGGGGEGFAPLFLFEVDGEWNTFAIGGTSVPHGVGEGNTGSDPRTSARGSKYGNAGYLHRMVAERLRRPSAKIAKATDGPKNKHVAVNFFCRQALLASLNPDHYLIDDGINEMPTTTTFPTWGTLATKVQYDVVSTATGCYICKTGGTTHSSGAGPATTAADITDGSVHWTFLWADITQAGKAAMVLYGYLARLHGVVPDMKIWPCTLLPQTSSTDQGKTVEKQTNGPNYGPVSVAANYNNLYIRKKLPATHGGSIGIAGFIDTGKTGIMNTYIPNPDGTAYEDFKWTANGVPYSLAWDFLHPSTAHIVLAETIPIGPFLDARSAADGVFA